VDAIATKAQLPSPEQAQKTITQLSRLFEATLLLNSTLDLAELLDRILQIARSECHADRGTVFLADTKRKELWSIVASGLDHQEIRVPYGRGVSGRVAETGAIIKNVPRGTFLGRARQLRENVPCGTFLEAPRTNIRSMREGLESAIHPTAGRFQAGLVTR